MALFSSSSLGGSLGFISVEYKRLTIPLFNRICVLSPHQRKASWLFTKIEAKNNTQTESAKVRNRRMRRKFNGTPTKPRLSVFCSNKQLYAMLVDDQNKKTLFYASTSQKSICGEPPCSKMEAAQRVGEELIKACKDLNIFEISSYDRNGFARGERMIAFEIPISQYGFLSR
ncbi:50S ribosomal protein L18, chloroplastic [Ananas comosus]|uniref:50S ribosomal protein L18, chloroplastic n=1 Tax=Ananas comosus TaxID=4615 RepID=A0A199VV68_ANACO|nr:50S ribosomal protein L18, chloroplastic [Ananas comosus]